MSTSQKPFGEAWIDDYFAMVDTLDLDEFVTWYHDDARFRFANQAPVHGKAAIRETLGQFYARIESMHHEKTGCWTDGVRSGAFEAITHYQMPDGREIAVPAMSALRLRDGLLADFRFVMDAAPLFDDASS